MANTIEVTIPINADIQRIEKKTVAQVVDEVGLQAVETEFLNGATAGGNSASKCKVNDANGNQGVVKTTALHIGTSGSETQVTATGAELNVNAGVTPGTVAASKAVVADANKDVSEFRNVGLSGTLTFGAGGAFNADSGTATATAGAATLDKMAGKITSEALTTAAGADYMLTLTNSTIAAADMVFASLANGTNTAGTPTVEIVTTGAGSVVFTVHNHSTLTALNGTIVVSFFVIKA